MKFTFRRSKRSNNGTDVSAGQIPELLYTLPVLQPSNDSNKKDQSTFMIPVETLSKEFYSQFSEVRFVSLCSCIPFKDNFESYRECRFEF